MPHKSPFQRSALKSRSDDPLNWRGHRELPEKISDDMTRRIMAGELPGGTRLVELDLAEFYGVSRGPIRDALRILAYCGLVDLYPRRGAVVIAFDRNTLADAFNVHAVLSGLNARYAAMMRAPDNLAEMGRRVRDLEVLAQDEKCKPLRFALASGRIGPALTRCADSTILQRSMKNNANDIVWALLWREFHVDFRTVHRRLENAAIWREVFINVEKQDPEAADNAMQELIFQCRDQALEIMQIPDNSPIADLRRRLHRNIKHPPRS